ncbi:O-acyltransferase WSD1-like [Neltuma alba]|uniref:O-acyltransferase WSD1-like n=1 Tax=Neltuma alba TaxID=207710 RepID=UPI0010A3E1A6|nr:O-acyltransferase WSD1-like [Prosopis alba]XP_028775278.1 O-acyltransferase WSD1-like [Prosopis alba]
MAQSLDSSSFWLHVLIVLEFEVPVPHLHLISCIKSLLSIPRFDSILVRDGSGDRRWERVEVKLEDHIIEPTISWESMSEDEYAKCFSDYLSHISTPQLPHSKPLWEVHVINSSITTLVLKVHHSIGDGYTLMSVLLSWLKRADDPSSPVTFPSLLKSSKTMTLSDQPFLSRIPSFVPNIYTSIKDFGWSLLKSTHDEDDKTPIRSGQEGVEFQPATLSSITFPVDHIKNIKSKLGVTVNDVLTGIISYAIRLYMQDVDYSSRTKKCTLLPMLNMRNVESYETKENNMRTGIDRKGTWGNKFTYTHVPVPELTDTLVSDPLQFVWEAHHSMKMKKRGHLVYSLLSMFLQMEHEFSGPEAVGKHFHKTMRNSSVLISNMVGPSDQLAMAHFPIKSLYFTLSGVPQSLVITITSYMGILRVTTRAEEGFMDQKKLASYVNYAFEMIHKAAMEIPYKTKL